MPAKTAPRQQATPITLGDQGSGSAATRLLRSLHVSFAKELGAVMSSFLRSDVSVELEEVGVSTRPAFQATIPSPACLMVFRLAPRDERMLLHLDCPTVFTLLEMLLGGKGPSTTAARNLTEIEWSLLEEIVRVMVRPLAEAWMYIGPVDFEVESLVSEPALLECPPGVTPLVILPFSLRIGEQTGRFTIAVPQAFFDAAAKTQKELPEPETTIVVLEPNLSLLQEASLDLEVRLDGPTMAFRDLLALQAGQVVTFPYSVDDPIHAVVNGEVKLDGQIVSAGKKRAFQISALP